MANDARSGGGDDGDDSGGTGPGMGHTTSTFIYSRAKKPIFFLKKWNPERILRNGNTAG